MKHFDEKNRLFTIYFLAYGAMACYYPYLSIYFTDRNFSYSKAGIGFALTSIIGVFVQPIWGYLTDRYSNKKYVAMFTMAVSSIFIYVFIPSKTYFSVIISIIFFVIFFSAVGPILDAYSYDLIDRKKDLKYGRIRLMGSAGYAITALILGSLIKNYGINVMFYAYIFLSFLAMVIMSTMKFKGQNSKTKINFQDVFHLLQNRKFILFLVTVMLVCTSIGSNGSYIAILMRKNGGDTGKLGIVWFVVAISELPVLFFGNRFFKKFGIIKLYALSALLFSVRYIIDSLCTNYMGVIAVQLMQSVTYTFFLMATLNYVNGYVPPNMKTSGITLYSSLGSGLGSFIGNIGGGFILQITNDIKLLYRCMSFVCFIAFILILYLGKISKEKASH